MWQIWPGQLFPASASQETAFVADLNASVKRVSRCNRDDITALMSMLRCGTSLEDALAFAPGIRRRLGALLDAHRRIDAKRSSAIAAWDKILADPSPSVWQAQSPLAAVLFPVAMERVAHQSRDGARDLAPVVVQVQQRMQEMALTAERLEHHLSKIPPTMPQASTISGALFTPNGPCCYADPFFVPTRLSVLTPARVADLIGEPRG
jgi:hypothetical protein